MTYIPKPGERVRVIEVCPNDGEPHHVVGEVTIAGSETETAFWPRGWCYLDGDAGGTWCRVEPFVHACPVHSTDGGCKLRPELRAAPPPRVAVAAAVRVRAYEVIATAIEHACEAGVHRAYKHSDAPSREAIADACATAVKDALCDVLDFGGES